MTGDPPLNTEVLIWAPSVLGHRWHRAVLGEERGRRGLRWRIYDYPGPTNSVVAGKQFQPDAWELIVPPDLDFQ